jgi:hypothetical protein
VIGTLNSRLKPNDKRAHGNDADQNQKRGQMANYVMPIAAEYAKLIIYAREDGLRLGIPVRWPQFLS